MLRFNQDIRFDDVLAGFTFTSDSNDSKAANLRQLDTIDLSSIVQAEIERGSDISAPYSRLKFSVLIKGYDERSLTF